MKKIRTSRAVSMLAFGIVLGMVAAVPVTAQDWSMFGADPTNGSSNGSTISTRNVGQLAVKWTVTTGGDVSARAAVVENVAYFPDWGGNLWAVKTKNGQVIWSHRISDYGLPAGTVSRTSPAVKGDTVFVGTQRGAWLLAIDANTGNLRWKTQLETDDPYAIISTSPAVFANTVYTGVASQAEGASLFGVDLSTAVARGSVVAVSANKGVIQWKTYTVPTAYTGGGVWGSNPVVDPSRKMVYVGTGDNYSHPQAGASSSKAGMTFQQCIATDTEANCLSPDDHVDSILALDMSSGAIKWARRMVTWHQFYAQDGSDDWNVDCIYQLSQCPTNPGPDYDFGSAPNEITYKPAKGGPKTIIGAGQKSGIYYALDPDTGATLWQTQVGPGSSLGGMEWGSATDGKRIYVAISNYYGLPYAAGSAGSWAALDPATGAILWQTADPNGAVDIGPVSVANGVVYAGSLARSATAPNMFALDAATGKSLWSFVPGVTVNAGATIVKDTVYWGSGYSNLGLGTGGNNTFYAFSVGEED